MAQAGFVQEFAWVKSAQPSSGPQTDRYPEAAAQTFVKGDPVKLDTAGRVLHAVDTEGPGIFGIANGDASGVTDALVSVHIVTLGDVLRVSQSNAGAAQVSAQTLVGLQCSWIKSTVAGQTTKSVLDTADTTTPTFEIINLRDAVGTENGEVYARMIATPIARAT